MDWISVVYFAGMALVAAFRALYCFAIYYNCVATKNNEILFTVLAFFFPIITGIVLLTKQQNREDGNAFKKSVILLVSALTLLAAVAGAGIMLFPTMENTMKTADHYYFTSIADNVYYGADGVSYRCHFEESGIDKLYDDSGKAYDTDLCYLDEDGMFYYDKRMNIIMGNGDFCVSPQGDHYYPIRYTMMNEDGSFDYSSDILETHYDREGNAYPYANVPFYNERGDKYYFSIASGETEGVFTNLNTGEEIPGAAAYVDKEGYLYDLSGEKLSLAGKGRYRDSEGEMYYKAVAVEWGKNGKLKYSGLED